MAWLANAAYSSAFIGNVATRCFVPPALESTNIQFNSRSWHFARDNIASLKIVLPNWYATNTGEHNVGGSATVYASIEYPAGTFTRVTWSGGATSISAADGSTSVSDFVAVSIAKNDVFYVRFFYTGATAAPIGAPNFSVLDTTRGDSLNMAASGLSDQTMSGTITNNGSGRAFMPAAIIALTDVPSALIIGDSLTRGSGDTIDSTGDVGAFARSVGGANGYISAGISGGTAQTFATSNTKTVALAAYVNDIVIGYGRNDFFVSSRTSAQFLADLATIIALFPGKGIITSTVVPSTSSTDSWATTGNQTALTGNSPRITANTAIRAGISGASHFAELANGVESAQDSGLWSAPPAITADGIHPNHTKYLALVGIIDPSWIVR